MEHVCARCPRVLGASCCEPYPGEKLATLTSADVARIREHVRRAAEAFVEEEILSDDEAREYEARRPLYRGYFRNGPVRLTLKTREGTASPRAGESSRAGDSSRGDASLGANAAVRPPAAHRACVFHAPDRGCVLPAEVRPLACRLYPFEQFPDGSWSVQVGRYGSPEVARRATDACQAIEESASMEDVLTAFGTTREEVEALGAQLAEAVRAHGSPD